MKKKKTDRAKLKIRLEKMAKDIVRARDDNICTKCKKFVEGSNRHCSHIIPESADHRLALEPHNMIIMCFHCHINWWHKNPIEASEWALKLFPTLVLKLRQEHLENSSKGPIKLSELEEIEERLKEMQKICQ